MQCPWWDHPFPPGIIEPWDKHGTITLYREMAFSSLVQTVTEIVVYKISGVSGSQIANCTSFIIILTTEVLTT